MQAKNHDYGEAWRDMRVSSFTDLILQKLLRVNKIRNNKGKTLISEGIDANYFDMINCLIFALIKLNANMQLLTLISRLLVGLLFIVSGLIKANDALGFSAYKPEEYFSSGVLNMEFLIPYSFY